MKAKDNQITGCKARAIFDQAWGNIIRKYGAKHIPIKHLEELINIPPQDITLTNIEWIDVKGIDTPFLVTLIGKDK